MKPPAPVTQTVWPETDGMLNISGEGCGLVASERVKKLVSGFRGKRVRLVKKVRRETTNVKRRESRGAYL